MHNVARDLRSLVRGDDYATVGLLGKKARFRAEREEEFEMKTSVVCQSSGADVAS